MAQTSIHIQPVKGGSEEHNKRLKELDYVRKDLTQTNLTWEECSQASRLVSIKERYKATTGQKLQKKATPIREGVVVIDDQVTMSNLFDFAQKLRSRFGIDCFQIALHNDEGSWHDGKWKANRHAHMVFDWTDKVTGKSIKLNRQQMAEIQTLCADCMNMERGVSSDVQHLSSIQFKEAKAKEELAKAKEEKEKAQLEAKKAEATRKEEERKAKEGFIVEGTKKIGNIFGFGKEAKQLKAVPEKIAEAKNQGRAEAVAEVCQAAGIKYNDMSKVTAEKVGRDLAQMGKAEKAEATRTADESNKKLSIIQNMAEDNLTYDEAAKVLKERYADMSYYKDERLGYCGNDTAFDYKKNVFNPLCEAQGAHKVATTENAIGRRKIVAQSIVIAAINLFDSLSLDKIANSLKALAEDFDLGLWQKWQKQPTEERKEKDNIENVRGWRRGF